MKPMRVLFIHQNFPGQFRHIARHLAAQAEFDVKAIGLQSAPGLPGIPFIRYRPHRDHAAGIHPYTRPLEAGVLHGQAVARLLLRLRAQDWQPDVVVAHPGWGESLFVKDVFPHARLIHFCEYFYRADGADTAFDPNDEVTLEDRARIRSRNALHLLALDACDVGICPTHWQYSLHPPEYQAKLHVIHEGIDTAHLGPAPNAVFELPDGRRLTRADEVVTYVARNLEPYRGFPQFMRALSQLQQQRPHTHALIVGGDDVSYGSRPKDAPNWREKMLREVLLDPARTHFTGKLPYARYVNALQVSSAHVYLTYPFVLSWSVLEAMACGCVVIGSDTASVREVIRHEANGYLTDFFDSSALATRLAATLDGKNLQNSIKNNARATADQHYRIEQGVGGYLNLLSAHSLSHSQTQPMARATLQERLNGVSTS